jgi:hypothetical protein
MDAAPKPNQLEPAATIPSKQDELRRQASLLHDKLHGNSRDGSAFKQICNAGVEPQWLEPQLVRLQRLPARSHGVHRNEEESNLKAASQKPRFALRDLESILLLPLMTSCSTVRHCEGHTNRLP